MTNIEAYIAEAEKTAQRIHGQLQDFQRMLEDSVFGEDESGPTMESRRMDRALAAIAQRSWKPCVGLYLVEAARGLQRVPVLRRMLDQKEQALRNALKTNRSRLASLGRWDPCEPRIALLRSYSDTWKMNLAGLLGERAQLDHIVCDRLAAAATLYRHCFRGRRVPSYRQLQTALGHEFRGEGVWPRTNFPQLLALADRELRRGRSWPWTLLARSLVAGRHIRPAEVSSLSPLS